MTTVCELYEYLNDAYPADLSCSWDNDGLMCCADRTAPVRRVLCALDVTEGTIEEAVALGCDCIVSHHPMIFRKMASVTDGDIGGRRVIGLLGKGITVMSFHTRLDAVAGGVNDTLCRVLGMEVQGTFGLDGEALGRIAVWSGAPTLDAFCAHLRDVLGTPAVHAVDAGLPVYRVAVLGGDGKDDWEAALRAGADTYLTGTMSYNTLLDARAAGLNVAAAGHFYTERPVMEVVAAQIRLRFSDVEAVVSARDCDVLTL